jgi:hypothetical protein
MAISPSPPIYASHLKNISIPHPKNMSKKKAEHKKIIPATK